MTTASQAIDRVLHDYLRVGANGRRNKLTGSLDASTTSFALDYNLGTIGDGSRISIDLEDMSVWTTIAASRTVEVDRGAFGSTAAAHSAGSTVLVNPDYTPAQTMRALNAAASRLISGGIFQVSQVELTIVGGQFGYDLTSSSDVIGIIDVWVESRVSAEATGWSYADYTVQQGAHTTDFASGTAIHFRSLPPAGSTVRVTYAHELSASLAALDDVVETVVGVEGDGVSLLCLGAAIELSAGKEIERNATGAAVTRRPEDVPPGAWTQAPRNLDRLFADRVKSERARLLLKYPRPNRTRSPLAR